MSLDAYAAGMEASAAPTARSFEDDRTLLRAVLADVISAAEGPQVLELHDRAVALSKRSRGGEEAAANELAGIAADLPLDQTQALVRSLTCWFQLVNLAEDNERVRRVRSRQADSGLAPRRGSMADAVERLARRGTTAAALEHALARMHIRLGETLANSAATMRTLLGLPVYRAALRAMGDDQEVMIGYSDSNKDVGYVASGWATYSAQIELSAVMAEHGVAWTFFHGRGGAVGRGGGPSNVAIRAQPPGTVAGRVKITEQGEVLAAKYSVREVAHRELELVASAVTMSALDHVGRPSSQRADQFGALMETMAKHSAEKYRALVYDDDQFSAFFYAVTPVEDISRLRIGSRPAKRQRSYLMEDFRAIPWVFSWTQTRIVLPAWYGLGTALAAAREEAGIEVLREMERDWPFFAGMISNAEMALTKADLGIGRRYAALCEDDELRERVWGEIEAELESTTRELLNVTGGQRLLDREPVLQRSIELRNAYVDPLSFVQTELLRRARAGESGDELARTTFLTINGIAGGLRNTG